MKPNAATGGVILIIMAALIIAAEAAEFRYWRTSNGRRSDIKLQLIEQTGDVVKLKREDNGKVIELPINRLSRRDREYVTEQASSASGGGAAGDSPAFRGVDGSGTSDETGLPVTWNESQNIVWKTALPGLGASSPITVGDRIFLTCYSGYGESPRNAGDPNDLVRHLVCMDRNSGRILWDTKTPSRNRVSKYENFLALHGYASSTPVCDGERIYCMYGSSGAYAFDMNGREVWDAQVGNGTHGFGTATSVVLHKDIVIVNASVESGSLIGLNRRDGSEAWRARQVPDAWSTPLLVNTGNRTELIVDTKDYLRAFNPDNGQQLWQCAGSQPPRYICPSPIMEDGVIYALHGYHGPLSAVRPGGNGDVTESQRVWVRPKIGSNVPSPVFANGHIFVVKEDGIFSCVNAANGDVVYRERLRPAPGVIYASPLAADGKIYVVTREKGTFVLAASPNFDQVAHNVISSDSSIFNGSPVVSRGQLLIRSDKFLYCIGG